MWQQRDSHPENVNQTLTDRERHFFSVQAT
jgi:hypothetical protein